ncbi:MAG: hypothetical protein SOW44_01125 [Porphyromonas sp.]|nr:hypothetical protein [Porphyromonas sp.]
MLFLRQRDAMDCGSACLAMVAGHWISTKTNGEEKGIALLLEPTDGFRIGEDGGKGYRTSVRPPATANTSPSSKTSSSSATNSEIPLRFNVLLKTMRKTILSGLILICAFLSVKAQVVCLDQIDLKPVPEVLLMDETGHILGLTDGDGKTTSTGLPSSSITFSHIGYETEVRKVSAGDTVWLKPRAYVLPEALVTVADPNADFTRMSTLVRCYQYIGSVPVYFTEALVDFFVPRKGDRLQYTLSSARAYRNDAFISASGTESGAVSMAQNGLSNFLLNTPFPLSKSYEVRGTEDGTAFEIYLNGDKKGDIRKTVSGDYAINLDMLTEKEARPRTLFGRTNTITEKQVRQTVPDYTVGGDISPRDFLTYRMVIGLTTKYKTEKEVPLLNVTEVFVLSKESLSKREVKALKTDDFFGNLNHSVRPDATEWKTLPPYLPSVPKVVLDALGSDLLLME